MKYYDSVSQKNNYIAHQGRTTLFLSCQKLSHPSAKNRQGTCGKSSLERSVTGFVRAASCRWQTSVFLRFLQRSSLVIFHVFLFSNFQSSNGGEWWRTVQWSEVLASRTSMREFQSCRKAKSAFRFSRTFLGALLEREKYGCIWITGLKTAWEKAFIAELLGYSSLIT